LGEGWVVGSVPEIAYDWKSHEWTVPLNLSGSKTMKFGRTPVVPNVIAQWLGLM
jgi:hypothetical protein